MSRLLGLLLLASAAGPLAAQPTVPALPPSQTLRLAEGALPEGLGLVRFYPDGPGVLAGDVDGDGRDDLILRSEAVPDVRTAALGDARPQTLLFLGPATTLVPSQLVFDELVPAGDLDGDGFADALTRPSVDGATEPVRWYRGSPGGYVEAGPVVERDGSPLRLSSLRGAATVGDLDGDGADDLVLLDPLGRVADLALVRGPGRVDTLQVELPTGTDVVVRSDGAIADLEGDGRPEWIVAGAVRRTGDLRLRVDRVAVAEGRPSVSLLLDVPHPSGASPALEVADLDGDGRPDLLVSDPSTREAGTLVFRGTATGVDPVPYRADRLVPIGDVDADGQVDALSLDAAGRPTRVRFGPAVLAADRTVAFAREAALPASEARLSIGDLRAPVVGDLDGDGRAEVVLGARRPGRLGDAAFGRVVLAADPALSLTPVLYEGAAFPAADVRVAAALGDVDGDGRGDLGVVFGPTAFAPDPRVELRMGGSLDGPPLAVLRRDREGGLAVPADVAAGDVDGDGLPDVAVAYGQTRVDGTAVEGGGIALWLGRSGFGGGPDWELACGLGPAPDDGPCDAPDVLAGRAGIRSLAVADLNADGLDDLAFVSLSSGSLTVLLGGPDLPDAADPLPQGRAVVRAGAGRGAFRVDAVGDVDADGFGDLLVCDPLDSTCALQRGAPDGLAIGRLALDLPAEADFPGQIRVAADVVGDGSPDLLLVPAIDRIARARVWVYEGGPRFDGAVDREEGVLLDLGLASRSGTRTTFVGELTALPDLDGDGRSELLATEGETLADGVADTYVLRGGSFEPIARLVPPNPVVGLGADNDNVYTARASAVADLDGDGLAEVVLAQRRDANDAPEGSRLVVYNLADLVTGERPGPSGFAVEVVPNPAASTVRARVELASEADVAVEVFDVLGRAMGRIQRTLGPGLRWVAFDASRWASGVYVLRLTVGEEQVSRTVTVAR